MAFPAALRASSLKRLSARRMASSISSLDRQPAKSARIRRRSDSGHIPSSSVRTGDSFGKFRKHPRGLPTQPRLPPSNSPPSSLPFSCCSHSAPLPRGSLVALEAGAEEGIQSAPQCSPSAAASEATNHTLSRPPVGCANGTSRNNHRLDGISDGFKVFADPVDSELSVLRLKLVTRSEQIGLAFQRSDVNGLYHREDASNILTNDPARPDVANNAQHFRPEVAVIHRSASLSCHAERLTGEASSEYRTAAIVGTESWNKSFIDDRFCQCMDVFMMVGGGEQGGQHVGAECANLTRYDRLNATPCGRHTKPTDAVEQPNMNHPRRHPFHALLPVPEVLLLAACAFR